MSEARYWNIHSEIANICQMDSASFIFEVYGQNLHVSRHFSNKGDYSCDVVFASLDDQTFPNGLVP